MPMNASEFRTRVLALESQIAQALRIKCPRVAARYQRQLDELKKQYANIQTSNS